MAPKSKIEKAMLMAESLPLETDSQEHYVLTGFSWAESSALGQTGDSSAGRSGGRLSELCIRGAPATASGSSSCERCGEEGAAGRKRLMVTGRPVRSPDRTRKTLSMRLPLPEDVVRYFWIIVKNAC